MIDTPQALSELMDRLSTSTWTLAAIGVLLESGLAHELREPRTLDELAARCTTLPRSRIARCLDVLASCGVVALDGGRYRLAPGALPSLESPLFEGLRGDCRSDLMQSVAYLDSATQGSGAGWRHTDPALLQAQGEASGRFAKGFATRFMHELGDLAARLARPEARCLDVGVGVAALAIALCRELPMIRVVGLDLGDAQLALARQNVASAGLQDRIELRKLAVQELRDEQAFDFAWVPAVFIDPKDVPEALARVHAALRPGGFVMVPALSPQVSGHRRAVSALVLDLWGNALEGDLALSLLADSGYAEPRLLAGPSRVAMAVGHRA